MPPGPVPAVYNIGTGIGTSVEQLAQELVSTAGRPAGVVVGGSADRPAGVDILELVADTTRAAAELGWRATVSLRTGLQEALAQVRSVELS